MISSRLRGRRSWSWFRVEVEGELVAGEGAGGQGAAHVERLGGPEVGELSGAGGDGVVEVEGVGEVELGVDVDGALVGDLVEVDVEVAPVGRGAAPTFGLGGVEEAQGVLDGAVDLGVGAAVGVWARWVST